jgi:hypothetical protein
MNRPSSCGFRLLPGRSLLEDVAHALERSSAEPSQNAIDDPGVWETMAQDFKETRQREWMIAGSCEPC